MKNSIDASLTVSYDGRQDRARHYPNFPLSRCPCVLVQCMSVNIRFILAILEEAGGYKLSESTGND